MVLGVINPVSTLLYVQRGCVGVFEAVSVSCCCLGLPVDHLFVVVCGPMIMLSLWGGDDYIV